MPDPSVSVIVEQLEAARQLFARFARRLQTLAASRLQGKLRHHVDPEDVMQSVLKSFFKRANREGWELASWDGLWGILTRITLRKCGHRLEYFQAAPQDIHRETAASPAADESNVSWEAIAREPTPDEAVMLTETLEQALRSLKPRERPILELRLQGDTVPEISEQLDLTEYTVEGLLKRIRTSLAKLREASEEG